MTLAYTNTELSKAQVLARVRAHREADALRFGDGDHCAVGCTVGSYDHGRYPALIGVPVVLAHLEDAIFEGFGFTGQRELGLAWPERFLSAIPEGADLESVWPQIAAWILSRLPDGGRPDVREAIDSVRDLYGSWIETGQKPPGNRFAEAATAARSAAWSAAAWSAEAAAWSVQSAAWSVQSAAWSAAATARLAAARLAAARSAAAAEAAFWRELADELIRLLESAPITEEVTA